VLFTKGVVCPPKSCFNDVEHILKINGWNPKMKVWKCYFSFEPGGFSASILIFQGVPPRRSFSFTRGSWGSYFGGVIFVAFTHPSFVEDVSCKWKMAPLETKLIFQGD